MTRDEAIVKVRKAMERGENTSCMIVDSLVAMGLLKLDDVESTNDRAVIALSSGERGIRLTTFEAVGFIHKLGDAGLKIVEK
jgi:hypothetical protein